MSKSTRGRHSHLTLSDRVYIEQELDQGSTFYSIAKVLHKDPTTISKEVKRARSLYSADAYAKYCKLCWNYRDCRERNVCTHDLYKCGRVCRYCWSDSAIDNCKFFIPYVCYRPTKAPFVCNFCDHFRACPLEKAHYSATTAQEKYEHKLVESRQGINLTPEELQQLNDLVSPLVLNGQPLSRS